MPNSPRARAGTHGPERIDDEIPTGAIFGIMTWFIAIGAVIILGAVAGTVWDGGTDKARTAVRQKLELLLRPAPGPAGTWEL